MKMHFTLSVFLLTLSVSAFSDSCKFSSSDKKIHKFLKKQGLQVASESEADFIVSFKDGRKKHTECVQTKIGKMCEFYNETRVNINIQDTHQNVSFLNDTFSRVHKAEFGFDDQTYYPEGRMKEMLVERHLSEILLASCEGKSVSDSGREIAVDKSTSTSSSSKKSNSSKQ